MDVIEPITVTPSILTSNVPSDAGISPWAAGTYAIDVKVTRASHIYRSLAAGNTVDPLLDTGAVKKWNDLGAINPMRMFDKLAGNKYRLGLVTSNPESITLSINPGQVFNAVAFFGIVATDIDVTVTDPIEGIVYNKNISMSDVGVSNWWEYFFKPISKKSTLILDDLPSYGTATLSVKINNPGGIASCALMVVGILSNIGVTQYGTSFGTRSFSRTAEDDFGGVEIIRRGYRTTVDYDIELDTWDIDRVMDILTALRDVPAVYIGYSGIQATITMGVYQDLSGTAVNWGSSSMALEIRSLY